MGDIWRVSAQKNSGKFSLSLSQTTRVRVRGNQANKARGEKKLAQPTNPIFINPIQAGGGGGMGRVYLVELEGKVYKCQYCRSHLAIADDLVSRSFHCRRGKAYLFNHCVNIEVGAAEERMMLSGLHTVADVFCCCCGQIVGWKYEAAHEKSQKYKEGKFVLERGRIVDGIDSDIFLDNHFSGSDAEDP